ncbi:hypothetical protein U3516DRAFT_666262 [Neocallimastix sp. 'constans']
MSLYEVDDVSVKRSNTLNKFLLKSREKEDNEERLKDKEDKKKLREEAKEEEKKKREEDKKKKDEEKKKKEEEKKIKEEEKKKEKEEKKKEKEEKRLKEKGIKDADETITGSNGFFHKFLHKNTVINRICSVDNLCKSSSNSPTDSRENLKRKISRSQPLLFDTKKKKNESPIGSTEYFSNVSSLINLLENNKFGSNNNDVTKSNDSISESHNEHIHKNRVKNNVKRLNQDKFNFNIKISNYDSTFSPLESNTEQVKSSTSPKKGQKDINNESITTIKDQSSSSNNGLLISKKVAAPPKRRPPTKKKLIQNAETAFTQRTGNDPNKIVNSAETSFNNLKDITSNKPPSSSPSLVNNNNLLENNNKEVKENCGNQSESDDDCKNFFDDSPSSSNAVALKKRMTQRLLSKQKFSDKLYPGGENCDSDIVEIKSIGNTSEYDSHGIFSEKEDNVLVFSPSRENIITKKNATFNGPVPPFRKERSTNLNLNGGCKAPKSPSSGNISISTSNITSNIPTKKTGIDENQSKLLISPRVNAKLKRRPPSHIGIAKNTKETIFTLKEDDEKDFLCPSKQESYMSNIKISEVKIAKKIDQKQINVLKLPSKGPTMINSGNIEDNSDTKNKLLLNPDIKKIKNSDSNNSLQNSNDNDNEMKEGKKSAYNSNRSSLIHPNFINELDGQLNKRASLRANTNINIEEKMQKFSKMKQEKQNDDNNKDIYNIKLKSKGLSCENNNKLPKENSGSNSELANNAFFKRRANIINSKNENNNETENSINKHNENEKKSNNEFDFSVIKLKNVKKVDVNQMKRKENNETKEDYAIETPTLVKPSNIHSNHLNKLGDNNPGIPSLKSSPKTPNKFLP